MLITRPFCRICQSYTLNSRRLFSSLMLKTNNLLLSNALRRRSLHASPTPLLPRKREFFTSNYLLQQQNRGTDEVLSEVQQSQKKRAHRLPSAKTSLRRVAVEAQRSRDGLQPQRSDGTDIRSRTKMVTAYCVAEQFNIPTIIKILGETGYNTDPYRTGLLPQVVHIQVNSSSSDKVNDQKMHNKGCNEIGDIFIFPSGTVVAWSVPEDVATKLISKTLLPAAENPHLEQLETEDLEYLEDAARENSSIKGDIIYLGTKVQAPRPRIEPDASQIGMAHLGLDSPDTHDVPDGPIQRGAVDTVLAKIAFSSGLARSTKLAVLESLLNNYFDSTRSIPTLLSRGSRLPFTRSFILRKTGQLLSVRAQLNLYSELTDSLPDLFWDSRHELGLEGYYDQVGRALDVGVRIKTLNEKMDYAQEIASVLRERLSEKHGLVLEWMIIVLIAVEVGFEILRLWKEKMEKDEHVRRTIDRNTT